MAQIKVDSTFVNKWITDADIKKINGELVSALNLLDSKKGKGNEFLGWMDLPSKIKKDEIECIRDIASKLNKKSEVIVVVGIGGSYLGARAVIDMLSHQFNSLLPKSNKTRPIIIYAGQNLSEDYYSNLLDVLNKKQYSVIVISKSGTTTEPAIAFRIIKNHIENKYGKRKAKKRIIAITDESKGALKKLADIEGYKTFVIPDNVGGRYSVLTPVGLLPIASAGFDIRKILKGALAMEKTCKLVDIEKNPALYYAALRTLLYRKGKKIEMMASYLPNIVYFIEWWKQLYGESEGKENKGIFPAGAIFTTDLHSMGQYIQDGERLLFETIISVDKSKNKIPIPNDSENTDGLNYLIKKSINEVNKTAELATCIAHVEGGVPNIKINIDEVSEETIGQLIYMFEKACAISGYMLNVNPFDQPGVEAYKNNMFALLEKPGYEKETKAIKKLLK